MPAAPSFADFITPAQLGCVGGGKLVPLQLYMQLLGTGANTPAKRMQQGTLYSDIKMSLLANTAAWLGKEMALAPRQQAADVAAFLTHSKPQHDKMVLRVRPSEILNEVTRRASPTLAGQLQSHFNILWGWVWPILQWAFLTTPQEPPQE